MDQQIFLWGLGISAAATILVQLAWARVKAVKVPRDGRWRSPPSIVLGPGVSETAVTRALDWWSDLGHEFGPLSRESGPGIVILVDPARVDALGPSVVVSTDAVCEAHGFTETRVDRHGRFITSADIFLRRGDDALAIAHEIGHALGYHHPQDPSAGHMMSSLTPGWRDSRGLGA